MNQLGKLIISSIFLFVFAKNSSQSCPQGSYINLCGYCVGGSSDKDEFEGLDRCGVCHGNSACVGCDGMINSSRKRDSCGMCLNPNAEQWNDCKIIDKVYPPIFDLSYGDDLITLTLSGAGLKHSDLNTTQCHIIPEENQPDGPFIKAVSIEDDDIEIQVSLNASIGKYKIGCSEIEGFADFRIVNSSSWNTISVNPTESNIDAPFELELEVEGNGINTGNVWCFIRTSGRDTKTLPATWISEGRVKCFRYLSNIPGILKVGIVATEDAATDTDTYSKTADFAIRGNPPIPETAEFSPDMQEIWIHFDQNIEMSVNCTQVFSRNNQKFFGDGFSCFTSGNILVVKLGTNPQILGSVEIVENNGIRRAGSLDINLSPTAMSAILSISKNKVLVPHLSLTLPSVVCSNLTKQPQVDVKISSMGNQKLTYKWSIPPLKEPRRSQRENLMMWNSARKLERELNSKEKKHLDLKVNSTVLLPNLEYVVNVRGSNSLGHENIKSSSILLSPTAAASVMVIASPSSSAIVAEANVTFCKEVTAPLRYRWLINDQLISEDGKLLTVRDLIPGIYNVSCLVYLYNSDELLGMGWTITQIINLPRKAIISPVEQIVGTMDEIVLDSYPPLGAQISWICKTISNERCFIAGARMHSLTDVVPNNSSTIVIPPKLLPVGSYILSLEGIESAEAMITIIPGIPPRLTVSPTDPVIDPTKAFSLSAEAARLQVDCRIWWSTIRQKGFNFFHLQEDVGLGDVVKILPQESTMEVREIPLMIPGPTGNWEGLVGESSYLLRLQTTCPAPTPPVHLDVPIVANAPPYVTAFHVSPSNGEALQTKFLIYGAEGIDVMHDYPLIYEWSYTDVDKQPISIGRGAFPRQFVTMLPPGEITLTVKACDIRKTCSSSTNSEAISVTKPQQISSEDIADIQFQIENFMLSGDSVEAFGLAITSFKTLSSINQNDDLMKLASATESAVQARLKDLSLGIKNDQKLIKPSLEFFDQAVSSLNFFPKTNGIVQSLNDFKNQILGTLSAKRYKRDTSAPRKPDLPNIEPTTKRNILNIEWRSLQNNDTKSNREAFLKVVDNTMKDYCLNKGLLPEVDNLADVVIGVKKPATKLQFETDHDIFGNKSAQISFKNSKIAFDKLVCIAAAGFSWDILGDTKKDRVSAVYEIKVIEGRDFVTSTKNYKGMEWTLRITNAQDKGVECKMWDEKGLKWSDKKCNETVRATNTVTCRCRAFGFVSVFLKEDETTTTSTTTTSTTTSPRTPKSASTTTTTTTSTISTTSTTTATAPTTSSISTTTEVANKSRDSKVIIQDKRTGYYFKIEEDYKSVVGKDENSFKENLKKQLADQLHVSTTTISNILIKPGSIVVTVFFVGTEQTPVEDIVKELSTRLEKGELVLKGNNDVPYKMQPQKLKPVPMPLSSPKSSGGMRTLAYGIVGGTVALIALFAVTAAAFKRKRSQLPLRMPKLSIDDTPTYRQFHNEFSLDGSSASLARYRRDSSANSEMF